MPPVAILSLGSPCLFSFYPRSGTEDCMKWDPANDVPGGFEMGQQALNTLSLLIFSQDAFWHHRHGIDAACERWLCNPVMNLQVLLLAPQLLLVFSMRMDTESSPPSPCTTWPGGWKTGKCCTPACDGRDGDLAGMHLPDLTRNIMDLQTP
eukprot:s1285_g19.t2